MVLHKNFYGFDDCFASNNLLERINVNCFFQLCSLFTQEKIWSSNILKQFDFFEICFYDRKLLNVPQIEFFTRIIYTIDPM